MAGLGGVIAGALGGGAQAVQGMAQGAIDDERRLAIQRELSAMDEEKQKRIMDAQEQIRQQGARFNTQHTIESAGPIAAANANASVQPDVLQAGKTRALNDAQAKAAAEANPEVQANEDVAARGAYGRAPQNIAPGHILRGPQDASGNRPETRGTITPAEAATNLSAKESERQWTLLRKPDPALTTWPQKDLLGQETGKRIDSPTLTAAYQNMLAEAKSRGMTPQDAADAVASKMSDLRSRVEAELQKAPKGAKAPDPEVAARSVLSQLMPNAAPGPAPTPAPKPAVREAPLVPGNSPAPAPEKVSGLIDRALVSGPGLDRPSSRLPQYSRAVLERIANDPTHPDYEAARTALVEMQTPRDTPPAAPPYAGPRSFSYGR